MAPRHDEIVKQLGDGFAIAWDTTERDQTRTAAVRKVVQERSHQLGSIIGTGTLDDGVVVAARRRAAAKA